MHAMRRRSEEPEMPRILHEATKEVTRERKGKREKEEKKREHEGEEEHASI